MQASIPCRAVLGLASLACSAAVLAQSPAIDYGKAEYVENCQGCHGLSGKGDGTYREYLTRQPSDLSVLAKNNGGVFPVQRVYEIIDGRKSVAGHGRSGDMPIWGSTYTIRAGNDPQIGRPQAEAYVRNSINLLIEYLSRLQQK